MHVALPLILRRPRRSSASADCRPVHRQAHECSNAVVAGTYSTMRILSSYRKGTAVGHWIDKKSEAFECRMSHHTGLIGPEDRTDCKVQHDSGRCDCWNCCSDAMGWAGESHRRRAKRVTDDWTRAGDIRDVPVEMAVVAAEQSALSHQCHSQAHTANRHRAADTVHSQSQSKKAQQKTVDCLPSLASNSYCCDGASFPLGRCCVGGKERSVVAVLSSC